MDAGGRRPPSVDVSALPLGELPEGRAGRYGAGPGRPAAGAIAAFDAHGVHEILELGCGQGRDTIAFAQRGFRVTAADFAPAALEATGREAREHGLVDAIDVLEFDVQRPLPFADGSFDGC